jgi:hypothetical protein
MRQPGSDGGAGIGIHCQAVPRSPGPALLHEFFDARWAEWRDRPAVDIPPPAAGGARRVATYADLHRAARVLERRLSSLIAGPDSLVAVLLPRTTVAAFAAPIAVMRAWRTCSKTRSRRRS